MLGKALTTAAAGNAAGEATYVEDVFSTYLYEGNGSTQTIENGIAIGDTFFDSATPSNTTASSLRSGVSIDDFFVELSGGVTYGIFNNYQAGEFLQVQYNQNVKVTQVTYRNEVGSNWAPTSVLIQSSSDGVSWNTELTYSDNGTTNQQVLTITSGTSATYWRMYQNSDTRGGGAGYEWHITQFSMTGSYDVADFGKGGLVWIKYRDGAFGNGHYLYDTERGQKGLILPSTNAQVDPDNRLASFNSDGFTVGVSGGSAINANTFNYASWTFAKQEKFFDVVTYTGSGSGGQQVSHNLGSRPGFILVKRIDSTSNWFVIHTGPSGDMSDAITGIALNSTNPANYSSLNYTSYHTDTFFSPFRILDQSNNRPYTSGATYVAYLFAHNNGDGDFGETGDQDIIKCGSYTGNGSADGPEIDLGFEPQWVLIKGTDGTPPWVMFDNMRGIITGGNDPYIQANTADDERTAVDFIQAQPTGFKVATFSSFVNTGTQTYIYIAIRRGPMKTPTSGTEVFAMDQLGQTSPTPPSYNAPWPVDMGIQKATTGSDTIIATRLLDGGFLKANATTAYTASSPWVMDFQNGFRDSTASSTAYYGWMFRRAPGFFDVVAHTGNGTNGHAIGHNLGVAPELILTKCRSSAKDWGTYALGKQGFLNKTNSFTTTERGYSTTIDPTATNFYLGTTDTTNESGLTYISYLFATLPGVSKVGSYTGAGSSSPQTIDCGFSSGARFVLIKATNAIGSWYVFDTERGITTGNDAYLWLNDTSAEVSADIIEPHSSGFIAGSANAVNSNGEEYIFLAIA